LVRGRGAGSETQGRQIQAEALKQEMEATGLPADKAGLSLANNQITQSAGKKSIGQLTTMQGSTKQAVDQLKYNIGQVQEDFKKLPSSDLSPVINAIARGEQKWTGDPAFSRLFFHMHATAMESARILAGGTASIAQLAPEAAKVAQGWANSGMTPKAFNEGSAPAMLGEGDNRLQTFGDAIKYQKLGGEGQKASSGLSSETKAPPVAEAYLKAHPEAKADFKAKYGYLPDEAKKKVADTEPDPNDPSWRREGGALKGKGFLGMLPHKGGKVSSEISIGVPINGKEMDVPSLVPTLTKDEIQWMLDGKKPTRQIVQKASDFAKKRIAQGKSVFANTKDGDY
jgi:hypothetical protein